MFSVVYLGRYGMMFQSEVELVPDMNYYTFIVAAKWLLCCGPVKPVRCTCRRGVVLALVTTSTSRLQTSNLNTAPTIS